MTDTTPPRCEPPPELRGVDGWHWVETQAGQIRFCRRWWKARGEWGWANMDDRTLRGFRYHSPVTPPAEVEALRAERDAAIARDRNASAAHAKRATDLWLVTEERDNLRAGTDRLIAERTTLRARVEALEAALRRVLPYAEAHDDAGPYGEGWKSDEMFADLEAARAALGGKP